MLLNQGIRTKLLAVLALPITALVIVTGVVSVQAFDQARKASQVEQMAKGSAAIGGLISVLQAERAVSVNYLAKHATAAALKQAQGASDQALQGMGGLIAKVDLSTLSPQAAAAMAQAGGAAQQLPALRASVAKRSITAVQAADQYAKIIAANIVLPQRIGDGLTDRAIGSQSTAFTTAEQLAELATQERDAGLAMIAGSAAGPGARASLDRLAALQAEAVAQFRISATPAQNAALDTALTQPAKTRSTFASLRQALLTHTGSTAVKVSPTAWSNAANDRIKALKSLTAPIAAQAADRAAAAASSARSRAVLLLSGGALLVALLILAGLVLSRTITRPLRRLTEAADQLRDELPRMVERMATPGEGPGVALPQIDVGGNDEVGRLARAFGDVNATTIRVAEEQAVLRASIAEMFVNVARRNHVLLSRQLAFIDQLERTEENPDTLENLFRLDHLATRMRRNAESLIVLAGIDAGRRLRRPMTLSDVIRTAVSEIERYDRVDLAMQTDPPMVGHMALTAAHLVAELLENATQFSNPDTRVVTSAAPTSHGVRLTITDLGLGMTPEEIAEANERIANPPMSEVVGSQRLGFFVVGRLARRLDAVVELKPGRAQGTVVTIELPPALFVPGSVAETPHVQALPGAAEGADDGTDPAAGRAAASTDPSQTVEPPRVPTTLGSEPSAPVLPPPFPPLLVPPAEAAPAPTAPSLPRRAARAASTEPAQIAEPDPAPAAPPAASRPGIFSGFRARRNQPAAPVEGPAPAQEPVEAAQEDFQPLTEQPVTPARGPLPQRGESVQRPPAPSVAAPETVPAPAAPPGPLDAGWAGQSEPLTEPVAGPLTEPVAEPLTEPVAETVAEPVAEPIAEPVRPLTAVPAMDILPSRTAARGLHLRRPAKVKAAPAFVPRPAAPVSVVDAPLSTSSELVSQPSFAAVGDSETASAPDAGEPHSQAEPTAPIAAPPSLFGSGDDSPAPAPNHAPGSPQAPVPPASAPPAPVPEPAAAALAAAQSLRERSAMASQALSELSALSSYRPATVQPQQPASLVRRTPQATPAGQLPPPAPAPVGARRPNRDAADVRSMLSGFQAGVERGRTSPAAARGTTQEES